MLKKMNLPNKLTMLRIVLVPVFIVFMSLPQEWIWPMWTAFGIFIAAAITDFLDGRISRKKNIVTKFGKIMDPLADKMLVSAGFILLTGLGVVPAWITAIIILRDFFVNALRMFGSDNGKDLAAGLSGKIKTQAPFFIFPLRRPKIMRRCAIRPAPFWCLAPRRAGCPNPCCGRITTARCASPCARRRAA